MIKSIDRIFLLFSLYFLQLKSQISQIDQNGYNAFCDEFLYHFFHLSPFLFSPWTLLICVINSPTRAKIRQHGYTDGGEAGKQNQRYRVIYDKIIDTRISVRLYNILPCGRKVPWIG